MINRTVRRACLIALTVTACLSMLSASPQAASCDGIAFLPRIELEDATLELNGLGVRKATMLRIYVYVAALYLPEVETDANSILGQNPPWQIVLNFVRDVDAEDIKETWLKELELNGADMERLAAAVTEFNELVQDVKAGDRLRFSHLPGRGLHIAFNDRERLIAGDEFARAILAIWLGPHPPNLALKEGLLGGPCP
ncbi:MAG: chalcone isomerase family protein [Pseudomonadota bacterium]